MRFDAEHDFAGPPDAVIGLLADVEFHEQLRLPDLAQPQLLVSDANDDAVVLRLRYEYVGTLDPLARGLLGDRNLTWIQELRLDRTGRTGRLDFHAEAEPRRLHGHADFVVEPRNSGSQRRLRGELVVAIPAVGGMAERRILPGLLRRLDVEARAIDERLRAG